MSSTEIGKQEHPKMIYRKVAYHLWKLLDDIDTLDDTVKSNDKSYRDISRSIQKRRWNYLDEGEVKKLYDSYYDIIEDDHDELNEDDYYDPTEDLCINEEFDEPGITFSDNLNNQCSNIFNYSLDLCSTTCDKYKKKEKEKIYIAGPYSPMKDCNLHDIVRQVQINVDKFIKKFHELKSKGFIPYVPVLSHYIHIHHTCPEDYGEWWYEYDLTILESWADSIYMLKGWEKSKGATMELEKAKELGLKIYYEIGEDKSEDLKDYIEKEMDRLRVKIKELMSHGC